MSEKKRHMKPKSVLSKEVEKIFTYEPEATPPAVGYEQYVTLSNQNVVVQTFTTYSVCEDPIPNLYRK